MEQTPPKPACGESRKAGSRFDEASPPSRRKFLAGAASLPILTGFSSCGGRPGFGERVRLDEAGPMVPPVPAVFLTVEGLGGGPDEISVVWTFVVNGQPPQVGVSVSHEHVAGRLIDEHREFVLNVPTSEIVVSFDVVDMSSTRSEDKFALSGLTRGRAVSVAAPTVEECPIHVECRVSHRLEVPPSRTLFVADVLATTALDGACDQAGRLNVDEVDFFGMTAGSGEFYTMGRAIGHIGQSEGRDDIKY